MKKKFHPAPKAWTKLQRRSDRKCRICGCTDRNCKKCVAKTGTACHWVQKDLCSACLGDAAAKSIETVTKAMMTMATFAAAACMELSRLEIVLSNIQRELGRK